MRGIRIAVLGVLWTLIALSQTVLADEKKILVLHSYHQGLSWTDDIMSGMADTLTASGIQMDLHVEYMDSKRYPPGTAFEFLASLYREKYAQVRFDLILLSDNNALSFLLARRNRLFADTPVVFCGINNFTTDLIEDGITGVTEDIDIEGTLNLARRLMPGLRQFFVINDDTPTGLANREKFEQAVSAMDLDGISVENAGPVDAGVLSRRLGTLAEDTAVVLFTFHRDRSGHWFSIPEYLELVAGSSRRPVLSFWTHYAGSGVLGGVMVNGYEQGRQCALIGLRILKGEDPSGIPVLVNSPNVSILDHRLLVTYDISEDLIPADAIVINRPESGVKINRSTAVVSAAVFVVLTALVVTLAITILLKQQAVRNLESSEARYRRLTENSPDMIYRMSLPEGRYEYVSPAAEAIFGYPPEVWYESPSLIRDLIHPDSQPYFKEEWAKLLKGELAPTYEYMIQYSPKETRWLHQRNVGIRDPNGRLTAVEGVVTDISARKKSEEDLRQAQKMESIGTLAGGIAHDFNNMLGIMLGNTELALESIPGDSPVRNYLEETKTAGLRARDVIVHLLTFSRKSEHRLKPVDLAALTREALTLLRASIPSTIDIRAEIPERLGCILADPTQIHQVIINLSNNAAQAVQDRQGGVLGIRLGRERFPDRDGGTAAADHVVLIVSDNGPGIAPDIIDRVFDPYFTTKAVGKGSGLGLSIVHGIVEHFNGNISINSVPGEGTSVTVRFPVCDGVPDPEPVAEPVSGEGGKILVVDDEPAIAQMLARLLRRLGYEVESRTDPVEGFACFAAAPQAFDLVITDMTMPRMTGLQLAEKIKALRGDLPVILCSGYNEGLTAEKTGVAKVDACVMKPVELAKLSRLIRDVLENSPPA